MKTMSLVGSIQNQVPAMPHHQYDPFPSGLLSAAGSVITAKSYPNPNPGCTWNGPMPDFELIVGSFSALVRIRSTDDQFEVGHRSIPCAARIGIRIRLRGD